MFIGENIMVIPKTKPKFAIFEPNTFEIARSGEPFIADFY